jgi:hypothetical protein
MARPSSFFNVLASLCFSISTFQAYAATAQSSSSVDVLYILSGATVQTFDVDAQTGFPTEEGSGVMLPAVTDQALVPSADDHFLYARDTIPSSSTGSGFSLPTLRARRSFRRFRKLN